MGLQAWRRLVEDYRGAKGWNYQQLSEASGLAKGAVNRMLVESEHSVQHAPELLTMQKLGGALDCPLYLQIEALGFDTGYVKDDAETARLVRQVKARPELAKLLTALLDMDDQQIAFVRGAVLGQAGK